MLIKPGTLLNTLKFFTVCLSLGQARLAGATSPCARAAVRSGHTQELTNERMDGWSHKAMLPCL